MALRTLLLCFVVAALAATASAVNRPEAETAGASRPTKQSVRTVVRAKPTVEVAFVRNGRLVRVERTVPRGTSPARHALRELLQGPTKLERHQGLRSAFRPGARLRSLRADGDTWLVRVSRSALGSATARTIETRLLADLGDALASRPAGVGRDRGRREARHRAPHRHAAERVGGSER